MRFGKIDDIKSRVAAAAIDASRQYCSVFRTAKKATGAANWAPTPPWSPTTSCCTACWAPKTPVRTQKCATEILNRQNADGGWPIYNDGPSNISASVKAYFALKMAGYRPDHPQLQKARERILAWAA